MSAKKYKLYISQEWDCYANTLRLSITALNIQPIEGGMERVLLYPHASDDAQHEPSLWSSNKNY